MVRNAQQQLIEGFRQPRLNRLSSVVIRLRLVQRPGDVAEALVVATFGVEASCNSLFR
jgi:hypothetical protein